MPQSMHHNVYRVVLKQGEVWVIDPTGAQFGYYEPLCSWDSFQQRISKVDRVNELGYVRHKVFYNHAKYPLYSLVSMQAEKEELVKQLEHYFPALVPPHRKRLSAILKGPEPTFESAKHEFLEQLSAQVKESLVRMYTPAEATKRKKEVEARMAQNQADPNSRKKFEEFLTFFATAMGNPSW